MGQGGSRCGRCGRCGGGGGVTFGVMIEVHCWGSGIRIRITGGRFVA